MKREEERAAHYQTFEDLELPSRANFAKRCIGWQAVAGDGSLD
jgi:hypothetical protein